MRITSMTKILSGLLLAITLAFLAVAMFGSATEVNTDLVIAEMWGNEEILERGKYLATVGNCATCHTSPGSEQSTRQILLRMQITVSGTGRLKISLDR